MGNANLIGAAILGIPLIVLAWAVFWRRMRPIFWFAFVLIAVGLGYLAASGALSDIARSVAILLPAKRT